MTWKTTRVDRVATVNARIGWKALTASEYQPEGYAFLSTPNIKSESIDFDNVNYISEYRYEESPELKLQLGDVLLAKDGFTLGITNVVRTLPRPATVNGSIAVLRPFDVESRFLRYSLAASPTQNLIQSLKDGMDILHLFQRDINRLPISLPSPDEQRRIADFLDAETARVDAIVKIRHTQRKLLIQRRFAFTRNLLQNGIRQTSLQETGIEWIPTCPSNWQLKKLSHITQCLDGKRIPLSATERATRKGPYPYYGASSIVDYIDDYIFDEELVLLGEDGAQLGNPTHEISSVITGKTWVNNHAHILRPNGIDATLLAAILNVFDREPLMSGSTREKITQESMNSLIIPVPPIPEQNEIAATIINQRSSQRNLENSLQQQIRLLEERRQALITAAVTGEIDVTRAGRTSGVGAP